MIVMNYMRAGSLRSNLAIKKYNPYDKYENLRDIAQSLFALHKCDLVHGDFHSGNILLYGHGGYNINDSARISDLGLSRPVDKPTNKSNEIYGVLPYIAPEVLRGNPYTKAADIYSFCIIMCEMITGIPAFNNIPHDFDLF
jgi:serine/threonine protein kinase